MKNFKLKFFTILLLAFTVYSCSSDDNDSNAATVNFGTAPAASLITTGTVKVITENTVRYHTIDFGTAPYTVTIVETENNVVLVDLGRAADSGVELKKYVDAINKPSAVIITHNHGDHYGGAASFSGSTFYAETAVAAQLNSTTDFKAMYTKTVVAVTGSQKIGDLDFAFDKVSKAETGENGYIYNVANKALFAGDLVYNLSHPYIREYTPKDTEDEISNWVAGLATLKTKFSGYNHVFVGHNGSRTDVGAVLDENSTYLQTAQGLIKGTKNLKAGGKATSSQQVVDELKTMYPTYKDGGLAFALPNSFFPGDTGADWF